MTQPAPTASAERIQTLDVTRGVALLGILLLNILGFGLLSTGYFNPLVGAGVSEAAQQINLSIWAGVDVLFEGAMRALFSLLFGAGVVLFTTGGRERAGLLHYRRNFWLLAIGLFDAYVLLWSGDILVTYALAGMVLYPLRNVSAKKLIGLAVGLVVIMSLMNLMFTTALSEGRDRYQQAMLSEVPVEGAADPATRGMIEGWLDFQQDYELDELSREAELAMRQDSYASAFEFNLGLMQEVFTFTIPVITFWDALAMMMFGMALFKLNWLDGSRSSRSYLTMMLGGFALGFAVNLNELAAVYRSAFDPLVVHGYMRPTYHLGRIGMALGYLGLVLWLCRADVLAGFRRRLAAVGRMALSNYLMHSLIALFLFTGAGLSLVGELQRWQLYLVVLAIWVLQLIISPWWLARYRFGPVEWVWRALTYGSLPAFRNQS